MKKFVATNRNKGKLIKRVDETFLDIWGGCVGGIIDNVRGEISAEQKSASGGLSHARPWGSRATSQKKTIEPHIMFWKNAEPPSAGPIT